MSIPRERLSDDEISARLAVCPCWSYESGALVRSLRLGDFDAAMRFIDAVADIARALDHHPEWSNVYDRVDVRLTTHDAGGVTVLDFAFAEQADRLLVEASGPPPGV